ncbi:hypothetical protein [Saccharothrix texasensis]|uniref:Uncharacterized protein n=1 Tax=Saccharothrix texasensis TaxID=103734 RepID=A0A3N1H0Z4_9PSEU|nr:hypothetical protein [Saccharothrix texasensis]ROP36056.1 hypothetical protein EDD40_1317 [Saccharothrix texasensis]
MIEVERRKRPAVAFAGFLVPFAAQLAVPAAFRAEYFADAGWHGGEYAYAFIGVAVGSTVLGCAVKFLRPPWNSVGTGLVLAGTLGFVTVLVVFAVFLVALSQWASTT